jgi:hypothetical protein
MLPHALAKNMWVPWFNCKQGSLFVPVAILSVLTNTEDFQRTAPLLIALLHQNSEVISVNEFVVRFLINSKRRGTVVETY